MEMDLVLVALSHVPSTLVTERRSDVVHACTQMTYAMELYARHVPRCCSPGSRWAMDVICFGRVTATYRPFVPSQTPSAAGMRAVLCSSLVSELESRYSRDIAEI